MKHKRIKSLAQEFFKKTAKDGNTLLVGGICNKCRFCYLTQTGEMLHTKYTDELITPEVFSECVDLLNKNKSIFLDISSNGMISIEQQLTWPISKEILDHPEREKLLRTLNDKTTGTLKNIFLTASNYQSSLKPFFTKDYNAILSFCSIDPEDRKRLMINRDQESEVKNVKLFMKENVDILHQVVISWTGNMSSFKSTIDYVRDNTLNSTEIWFQQLGYTKYSDERFKIIAFEADLAIDEAYNCFKERLSGRIVGYTLSAWVGNEIYVEEINQRLNTAIEFFRQKNIPLSDVAFIGHEVFLRSVGNPHPELNWIYYKNYYFGGNIIGFDHTPFRDIHTTIEKHSKKFSHYVLSKNIFFWKREEQKFDEVDILREKPDPKYNFFYF